MEGRACWLQGSWTHVRHASGLERACLKDVTQWGWVGGLNTFACLSTVFLIWPRTTLGVPIPLAPTPLPCRALASIFESLPTLVPPYGQQQRQQQQQGGSQEQQQQLTPWQAELLRSFLQAVLHDVLRCVRAAAALAAPANAPGKPDSKLEQVRGMASKPLLPPSDAEWAALSNSVFSVQQQLGESVAPLESVNSLYQSHAVHAVWEGEGGGGPTAGGGRPPQPVPARPFRPPDFSWGVAKHAVQLLQMLAALPEAAGVQWAMAAFPAVHVLVVGVPCRQLLGAYQALRKALEAARGVKAIAGFKLPPWWQQQQQQPGAVPAPGAQQQPAAAGVQQQQRQQQQQQGAPAPAQAVAGQQPLPPAQTAPTLSVATVTASVLTSRPAAKPGAQAALPARQPLQSRPTQEATTQRLPSAMVPTGLLLTQQSHLQGSVQQERPRQPPPVQQPAAAARPAGELGAGPRAGGGGPQPLPSRAADSSSKRRPAASREADSSSKRARAGGTRPLSLLDSLELKAVVDVLGLLSTQATEHPVSEPPASGKCFTVFVQGCAEMTCIEGASARLHSLPCVRKQAATATCSARCVDNGAGPGRQGCGGPAGT